MHIVPDCMQSSIGGMVLRPTGQGRDKGKLSKVAKDRCDLHMHATTGPCS